MSTDKKNEHLALPIGLSSSLPQELITSITSSCTNTKTLRTDSFSSTFQFLVLSDSDRNSDICRSHGPTTSVIPCVSVSTQSNKHLVVNLYDSLSDFIADKPNRNLNEDKFRTVLSKIAEYHGHASGSQSIAEAVTHTKYSDNKLASNVVRFPPGKTNNGESQFDAPIKVTGKFLEKNGKPFYIQGATYGTFAPDQNGDQYPSADIVKNDFVTMAASGINSIRVYTVPPQWLLDLAKQHSLHVMVGIPWEQHIALLDDSKAVQDVQRRFRRAIRQCKAHPAIFCFSIGNEIPAGVVRWHGEKKVTRFLKSLYDIVKSEAPDKLVTYVNFPTTEFLSLDFIDLYCFNVYLESEECLAAYLDRLQTLAGPKPLLLAEVGLDSLRNGESTQAACLETQIETIFDHGAVGTFVFSWTDEWYVGGRTIEDWFFGLTTTDRKSKPALASVKALYQRAPFINFEHWPSFTVVVCSYNGSSTIRQTLERLNALDYPDYEVIVVNDGSTDTTADIVKEFPVTLISTENKGLSSARNTGYLAGSGDLVAYIDDDAFPEEHWLRYLAMAFIQQDVAAVGGPNYPVPNDVMVADCVANAPGGPMEVMLTDNIAEHIPGCNMSFRRSALNQIGGFDPQFRAAGDDVDLCWRIQQEVGSIGFQPAAFNWHRRRNTVSGYWKQQKGYGVAESLLEKKWPMKYNQAGHLSWQGRLYGQGFTRHFTGVRNRIYQGVWGSAPFQRVYQLRSPDIYSITLMPEWMAVIATLSVFTLIGLYWTPIAWMAIPCFLSIAIWIGQAFMTALSGCYDVPKSLTIGYCKRVATTTWLAMIQPVARFTGRVKGGLTPMRTVGDLTKKGTISLPLSETGEHWTGTTDDSVSRLTAVNQILLGINIQSVMGSDYDNWDLEIPGGVSGSSRLSLMVEHHGEHSELVRYRITQKPHLPAVLISVSLLALTFKAISTANPFIALLFLSLSAATAIKSLRDSGHAARLLRDSVQYVALDETTQQAPSQVEESIEGGVDTRAIA